MGGGGRAPATGLLSRCNCIGTERPAGGLCKVPDDVLNRRSLGHKERERFGHKFMGQSVRRGKVSV